MKLGGAWRAACLAGMLMVVVVGARCAPTEIRARRFILLDEEGTEVASLFSQSPGHAELRLGSEEDRDYISLFTSETWLEFDMVHGRTVISAVVFKESGEAEVEVRRFHQEKITASDTAILKPGRVIVLESAGGVHESRAFELEGDFRETKHAFGPQKRWRDTR